MRVGEQSFTEGMQLSLLLIVHSGLAILDLMKCLRLELDMIGLCCKLQAIRQVYDIGLYYNSNDKKKNFYTLAPRFLHYTIYNAHPIKQFTTPTIHCIIYSVN